ncbi:hypothetical protein [Candidatus Marimicrobium litorale]|uniref:Uncharacterized protein n=1 Tax=Candidatus Marimicrobium litorale TaxID=2518991 RepID=A0ABT3T6C5_9GAMM|nr:hypothetical protein [Candidatus Marimicrobium litorale]MCX2977818.1 hypothetical protein [Candidatus Marimicrobium litorale]
MNPKLKHNLTLLICLGLLFSIPIVGKTWSAHGMAPALGTAILVVISTLLGPLAFLVGSLVDTGFVNTSYLTTSKELALLLGTGTLLFLGWIYLLFRRSARSTMVFLLVTSWALLGVSFCIVIVFTHTT